MSLLAQDLRDLRAMPQDSSVQREMRKLALNLIAPGVADQRGGL
jgi:hypothetical protein